MNEIISDLKSGNAILGDIHCFVMSQQAGEVKRKTSFLIISPNIHSYKNHAISIHASSVYDCI